MNRLDLRSRLLAAVGLVAFLQVVVAIVLVSATKNQMLDQVDDRLAVVADTEVREHGDRGDRVDHHDDVGDEPGPSRFSDLFEGYVGPDGELVSDFLSNGRGEELAAPEVGLDEAIVAARSPITVEAEDDLRYRVTSIARPDGGYIIVGIPLDAVDETMQRLGAVVTVLTVMVALVLALVTWWVLRLGIAPIKRMTVTAEAIADGDMSERIVDIDPNTEAGQLAEALNTMLGRIETSFEEQTRAEMKLRQFIADASHELRTPVATIRGYAELYQMGGLDDKANLDDAMRRTEQESQRMTRLIADLLDLTKLDRGVTLELEPVDLAALARDSVADARATYPDRRISIDSERAEMITGDEDLLRQMLANLVGNAIVHTGPEAEVSVEVGSTGGEIVVKVVDTGDGMAPEVVAKATERFFRADPSRSRHSGGSGLGLAIAAGIAEAHHGTLTIDSVLGEGTSISVVIPSNP